MIYTVYIIYIISIVSHTDEPAQDRTGNSNNALAFPICNQKQIGGRPSLGLLFQ
jgi:hypothetical protein